MKKGTIYALAGLAASLIGGYLGQKSTEEDVIEQIKKELSKED